MDIDSRLLNQITDYYLEKAVKKAVYIIQRLPKEAMSMNAPYLKNVWDEICVQKQEEECLHWELIDSMVEGVCSSVFDDLPEPIQMALSYQECGNYRDYEFGFIYPEIVVDLIKGELYRYACDYSNKELEKYFNEQYKGLIDEDTYGF